MRFYDSGKGKQRYQKRRIVQEYEVYRELIRNTYSKHCFLWISKSGFKEQRVEGEERQKTLKNF